MSMFPVAILAYLLLGIEYGLEHLIGLGPSENGRLTIAPRLTLVLLVYLALYAPPRVMLWLALLVGLATDLLHPITVRGNPDVLWLVGPHAIGYLAGVYAVIVVRGYMIKRNPLTLPALSVGAGVLAALVAAMILTFRKQIDSPGVMVDQPSAVLLTYLGSALYTGAVALPMFFLLRPLSGVLGLTDNYHRRGVR